MFYRALSVLFFIGVLGCASVAVDVVHFRDPSGDDNGPGRYLYPSNPIYAKGSFDLAGLTVKANGGRADFRVDFYKSFGPIPAATGPGGLPIGGYRTRLFLQNIEIYIDTDHVKGSGNASALPGRRANMAYDSYWEKAVIVAPMPEVAKRQLSDVSAGLTREVFFSRDYRVDNNSVSFSVPVEWLGTPESSWGYVVLVTPADFAGGGSSGPDLAGFVSGAEKKVFIREVKTKPSSWNFGGGDASMVSPNIIDILLPSYEVSGVSYEPQGTVLGAYNAVTSSKVVLPAVYLLNRIASGEGGWSGPGSSYSLVSTILSKDGKYVRIDKGSKDGVSIGRVGEIFDEYGEPVTNVIVEEAHDTYSVCRILKVSVLTYVSERMTVYFK